MILRPLLVLTSLLSIVFAGFWPAFVDRAVLNVRQVIGDVTGEETTDAAGAGAATGQQTQAAGNAAATVATQQTQAAGAGAAATATAATAAAANPANAATTATTRAAAGAGAAAADTDTETTSTATPAAAAPVAPAAPAAPAADIPAANDADFEVPYTMQTGTIRYAPMAKKVPASITKKNPTPLYPTSDYTVFTTKAGAASVVVTVTQPFTFQTVSSEAKNIAAASPPADSDMQKFLNRWKD